MTSIDRPSSFLSVNFDEAVSLCHEARAYFERLYERDCAGLSGQARLTAGREAMRLTVTVAQVLAWLMAYRSKEHLDRRFALSAGAVQDVPGDLCLARTRLDSGEGLPEKLQELLDRGENLYQRITRLESAAPYRR